MTRIEAGSALDAAAIKELAGAPDILPLGMLADAAHRQCHGNRVTYVRVASCSFDASFADAVPPAAREIEITGQPEVLDVAVSAVVSARAVAGERTVIGFSWRDVERWAASGSVATPLRALREAGLDGFASLPLDVVSNFDEAMEALRSAGFTGLRLTVDGSADVDRTPLWIRAAELQARFAIVQALSPLPGTLRTFRPTTGYQDVKAVALARLAAPNIPSIQVDWTRYGPKLAQVALTFGADDVWGIAGSDAAPEGRRRAPLEEIRRNIEAAGFEPVERDGRFA